MFLRDSSLNEIRTGLPELGSELSPGEADFFLQFIFTRSGPSGLGSGEDEVFTRHFLRDLDWAAWAGLLAELKGG